MQKFPKSKEIANTVVRMQYIKNQFPIPRGHPKLAFSSEFTTA